MSVLAEINQEAYDSMEGTVELKSLYAKSANGMYRPDVEAVNGISLEDVSGLKSSLSKTLERAKTAEKKIKEIESKYEGIEPEKAKEAIEKLKELASGKLDDKSKAQIEAAINQFKDKAAKETEVFNKEIEKLQSEVDSWKKSSIKNAKTTAINEAIAKTGVNPTLSYYLNSAVHPELQEDGSVKLIINDKQGNVKLSNKSGSIEPMTIEEHINELKGMDSFAAFFPGSGATGSGATGSNKGTNNVDLSGMTPEQKMRHARQNSKTK